MDNELKIGRCWNSNFLYFTILLNALFIQSCEFSHSVPFDFPDYHPKLIIHAVASPQSGGRAIVKYNRPVKGFAGEIPPLPPLQLHLAQDGNQLYHFRQDSLIVEQESSYGNMQTAYFSIPPDSFHLRPNTPYTLEAMDTKNNKLYYSTEVYLPPKPVVSEIEAECLLSQINCSIRAILDHVEEQLFAISISIQKDTLPEKNNQKFTTVFTGEFIYPDMNSWEQYVISSSIPKYIIESSDSTSRPSFKVNISYLSEDITRLYRDIDNSLAIGEDIFSTLRPFHSNIIDAIGVFGLYNENVKEVRL